VPADNRGGVPRSPRDGDAEGRHNPDLGQRLDHPHLEGATRRPAGEDEPDALGRAQQREIWWCVLHRPPSTRHHGRIVLKVGGPRAFPSTRRQHLERQRDEAEDEEEEGDDRHGRGACRRAAGSRRRPAGWRRPINSTITHQRSQPGQWKAEQRQAEPEGEGDAALQAAEGGVEDVAAVELAERQQIERGWRTGRARPPTPPGGAGAPSPGQPAVEGPARQLDRQAVAEGEEAVAPRDHQASRLRFRDAVEQERDERHEAGERPGDPTSKSCRLL